MFGDGVTGHTYRLGLGAGRRGLSAGLAMAIYRGDTKGMGWDFGVVYEPLRMVALGAVLRNVRQPVVRGIRQDATLVPTITLKPVGSMVALSAESRITSDSVLGYAVGGRVQVGGRVPFGLLVRFDADQHFHQAAWVFGISIGSREIFGTAASIPSDVDRVDATNFYGVVTRTSER